MRPENPKETTKTAEDSQKDSTEVTATGTGETAAAKPKLSGAARRRLKKERLAKEGGGSKQPPTTAKVVKAGTAATGTPKRHRSDGSTPKGAPAKKVKGPTPAAHSFKDAAAGFQMAIAHQDLGTSLTEDQTGRLKEWILEKIDAVEAGKIHPKFTDCRHRDGALRITCCDQDTKDWLGGLVREEEPWKESKLQFVEAKNLPKPVRALVWIPGPSVEPEKILKRLELQNKGMKTAGWKVVDRKEDPKGQQLVVLMDQTSWDTMEPVGHRPYLNFTRVKFKALAKKKEGEDAEEEPEKMEVEGAPENPPPSTSSK